MIYKIISKEIANHLITILPKLISKNQGGFVTGRLISENIALAHEQLQHISRRARGATVILKIDMEKAFDRVFWDYLVAVLKAFGFADDSVALINKAISSPKYSIKINGGSYRFFLSYSWSSSTGSHVSSFIYIK